MSTTRKNSKSGRWGRRAVWAILLVIVGSTMVWVYSIFNPSWRVRVYITNIPAGTNFISLVADSGGALCNMDWSPSDELSIPFIMHPAECIWSHPRVPNLAELDWDAYVQWQQGERYGVVTRNTTGTWNVCWIEADAIPVRGQRLFGNRVGTFDLATGKTVPLLEAQLEALGLDKALVLD